MTHREHGPCRRATLLVTLGSIVVLLAGCQWFSGNRTDPAAADSLRAATDSLSRVADSLHAALDSLSTASGEPPDSSAIRNTTRPVDASRGLGERLDSLTAKIERLGKSAADGSQPIVEGFFADLGWKLLKSLLVLVVAYYVIRLLVWILGIRAERSAARRLTYMKAIPVVRIVIWTIAIYYIIRFVFLFNEETLIVAGGAIGVAVGFAAQDALKNVFGGIMIILDQPFQVGDKVRIEGTYGEVVSIGLRSTRIVTPDDNLVSVPNTQVVNGQVANANAGALDCQVVTEIFLPGWVDVAVAKKIAYDAAATSKYVYLDKPIVVLVKDFFDHAFLTKIIVKAYVLDTRYEQIFSSDVTERAKTEYLSHGLLTPDIFISGYPARGRDDEAMGEEAGS